MTTLPRTRRLLAVFARHTGRHVRRGSFTGWALPAALVTR